MSRWSRFLTDLSSGTGTNSSHGLPDSPDEARLLVLGLVRVLGMVVVVLEHLAPELRGTE